VVAGSNLILSGSPTETVTEPNILRKQTVLEKKLKTMLKNDFNYKAKSMTKTVFYPQKQDFQQKNII